jgi:formylglycine-generating enzyme required for sulfatase activity/predicted Ser/Thr protein kinase
MMNNQTLTINSELKSPKHSYHIEKVLGQGSFGITYLASAKMVLQGDLGSIEAAVKVCIKEFFMSDFNTRREDGTVAETTDGSLAQRYGEKFRKEAINLSRLHHQDIVNVVEVFDANNTHYYVMEYIDGVNLDDYIRSMGSLSEQEAIDDIKIIAGAVGYMHGVKMLHLDLKPKNIMRRNKDGKLYLIDFGLSKQYDDRGEPESSTTVGLGTKGYAPIEQGDVMDEKSFQATLDIYALGATFYKMLTGMTPMTPSDILNDGFPEELFTEHHISDKTVSVVKKAMAIARKQRYQNVDEFLTALCGEHLQGADDGKEDVTPIREEVTIINESPASKETNATENEKTMLSDGNNVSGTEKQGNLSFNINGISFKMIKVDGGTFSMGKKYKIFGDPDESPVHSVTLSDFYIGQTEVTQALWKAVMGINPSKFKGDDKPVETVSWDDCYTFIAKLNKITGKTFSMPTEAQWEFAAKGGNLSNGYKFSGSNYINDVAWYIKNSGGTTHDVGTKSPNELELYDMNGNVWEWCCDWYGYYSNNSQTNPTGPSNGSDRVLRGGSWRYIAGLCRVSTRGDNTPDCRGNYIGLRLVL